MKKSFDKKKIDKAIKDCIYGDLLKSLSVPLFLIEYSPGETISSPMDAELYFQVVISGSLSIYYIRDDGTAYSLSSGADGYVIGEMDLFTAHDSNVYAEASSHVVTIACDSRAYKDNLLSNNSFTRFVAATMAKKLEAVMNLDATFSTLEERVINYMTFKCEDGTLKGIEKAAFKLHCSSRQLQRIMNSYVDKGVAEKLGKGCYRLV